MIHKRRYDYTTLRSNSSLCQILLRPNHRSHFSSSVHHLSRHFSSLTTSVDADDNEKQENTIGDSDDNDTIVLPKLDLLSTLETSPFQANESTSTEKDSATKGEKLDDNTKPSLLELLSTDLFSQSWSGPDMDRYGKRQNQPYQRGDHYSSHSFEGSDGRIFHSRNPLESSAQTYTSPLPSAEKTKLDSILKKSNELLDSLSTNDSSSTLQLMDFDSVMAKLSRFNSEMENDASGNRDGRTYRQGYSEKSALKREAADKCLELLYALERNYDCILHHDRSNNSLASEEILPETKHSQLMPGASSYNHALHTLAHSGKGQRVATEASATLDRMLDRCQDYLDMTREDSSLPLAPPEPTIMTFNSTIHAIAKSGVGGAGYMAEEVFSKMEDWHRQCRERQISQEGEENDKNRCYNGVAPDARTLSVVLDAWSNRDAVKGFAPERAESILNMAINRRRAYVKSVKGEGGNSDLSNHSSESQFESNSFIHDDDIIEEEYADEEMKIIEEGAHQFADKNVEQNISDGSSEPFLRPNTVAFNTCINAWATCGRGRIAAARTQELLSHMEAISESGELDLPDVNADDINSDESALIDHSLRPNKRSYSMVMKAWANVAKMERWSSADAAEQCEAILNRMEIKGASDVSVRPNLVAYVTTITAWSRTKAPHASSRAENILNRLIDMYYDGNDIELPSLEGDLEHAKHDAPFNAVITAYARSGDPNAAERAFAVLERLEVSAIAPSLYTYNAVMDVCAKHGDPEKALQILDKMETLSVIPDSTSYDTILNAFGRHEENGSAERAWELLRQWEEDSASGDNASFTPTKVSYSAVINGFAKASGKEYGGMNVVKKAKEIYDRLMEQMTNGVIHCAADPVANSCFLNCCANMHGTRAERKEALVMAIKAFEEMKKNPSLHGEPSQFTFGTMMKACARLSADAAEKNRLLESLFVQTCKRGLLSRSTLGQFLRHTPNEFNTKVILKMGGSKREIPPAWHRNVPNKHKPTPSERSRY